MTKKEIKKEAFFVIIFLLIFVLAFTALTLLYYPKRSPEDSTGNLSNGIYLEDENSVDVLLVGSCNMYTSFNPLFFYENTGVTSYGRTCPDQIMITSYYYIEETLKRQTPKVVVVDTLFVGDKDTDEREAYNRCAVDFMRPNLSKLGLINALSKYESAYMQSVNPSNPSKALTWAGYVFPLLRYHHRMDFKKEDLTFFLDYTGYNYHKGSESHSNYNNINFEYDFVNNSTEVREDAKEYVPKIIKLCKEKNIPLIFINTPNKYRWDDTLTASVKNYIESQGGTFLDLYHEYGDMLSHDYYFQSNTGRLNVYGMEVFTERFGSYLVEKFSLKPTPMSDAKKAQWQADINTLYAKMKKDGAPLEDGQLAQVCNKNDSILVRWNLFKDCKTYELYKRNGAEKEYTFLGKIDGNDYYDKAVKEGEEYSYYIVPCEGAHKGEKSEKASYVFVEKPKEVTAIRNGEEITVIFAKEKKYDSFAVERRKYGDFRFFDLATVEDVEYKDSNIKEDTVYFYRVMNCIEKDGKTYYSDGTSCKES